MEYYRIHQMQSESLATVKASILIVVVVVFQPNTRYDVHINTQQSNGNNDAIILVIIFIEVQMNVCKVSNVTGEFLAGKIT